MPIKVTMLLADSAQAVDGKLYVLGGGWNVIGPEPSPFAVAISIDIPWDMTNVQHRWLLELVDSDGDPVLVPVEGTDDLPLRMQGHFEVGRPPGLHPGSGLGVPLAFNFGPVRLQPSRRYEWRLTINEVGHADWRLPFSTRPATALA